MFDTPEELQRLYWTAALALGVPLTTVVLVELEQSRRRLNSKFRPVFHYLRVLFLPLFAVWVALIQVVGLGVDDRLTKIVATLADVSGIVVVLSLVNAILFSNVSEDSWQARTPKLLVDIVRLILVIFGGAIVLSLVWGVDLGQLAAALGIGSIVIGLAIAEPLGNVFAGLMLLVERPIAVGNWIKIGDKIGQVIEINWRAIHLRTYMRELIVVPNAILAKESFTNFSRPTRLHCEEVTLGFSYDDSPNKVRAMLMDLLESTPGVMEEPPPMVRVVKYGDFAIDYTATFFVEDYLKHYTIRDAFMTKVWYAIQREGITIPFPTAVEFSGEENYHAEKAKPPIAQKLAELSILAGLSPQQRTNLESGSFWRSFAWSEVIAEQGSPMPGLFLIVKGRVRASHFELDSKCTALFEAGPGEIFGESIANGNRTSEASFTALEDVDCIIVKPDKLQEMLMASTRFAAEVSQVTELRRCMFHQDFADDLLGFRSFDSKSSDRDDESNEESIEIPEDASPVSTD